MTTRQTSIFVSSAYQELIACRQAAIDAVWRCEYYPTGMERGNYAMPYSTSDSSRKMVDEAVVYIGVFSHRYGVITAEELRRAEVRGIPILPFIATEPQNDRDNEPDPERQRLLEELKRELLNKYVVGMFSTPEELGAKVYRSLVALRDEGKLPQQESATGWEPAVIPTPPTPYEAHPYLLGASGFVGRRTELDQLDSWARASEPMLIVDAIGGAGKSALAWNWTQTRLNAALPNRAGVVWWSFYESNATMGTFLARTLAYLTQRSEAKCARLPRPQQEEQVLAALAQQPSVVVMDGLERLLVAYHRMDAARLADAEVEAQPRACIDPRDGAFLRKLTRCAASKVIITSRLLPTDLQDRAGQLLQGVRHLPLYGLTTEDAIALMEQVGVHGSHELMRTFLSQYGDHALLTQVLAARVGAYRPAPEDFNRWYQEEGRHIRLDARDLTARQASILDVALADLDPAIFRFLCQMAAFRYPVDYAALVALNSFTKPLQGESATPSRPHSTSEEQTRYDAEAARARLNSALSELEERALIQWDRAHNRYDLHPVVRSFAYARLEDKTTTFARLRSYFEAMPAEDEVRDVADLRRTLEIYHALVESSLFDQAIKLYRDRLGRTLSFTLGAYTTIVEVLTPLFPKGFAGLPALSRTDAQGFTGNELAMALNNLGEYAKARMLFGTYLRHCLQMHDAHNLGAGLVNLGGSLLDEGRSLAATERVLVLVRDLATASADQWRLDEAQRDLIELYAHTGVWSAGEAAYAALLASPEEEGVKSLTFPLVFAARLRFGQRRDATALLDEALTRARSNRFLRGEREARRLQGEIALAGGDLSLAEEAWQVALAIAQRESKPLGPYLANLARLRARQGHAALARELIAEAVTLGGLGVALAATEVYLAVGDTAAMQYAVPAYTEAWADGPPYALELELERARAALTALGMPEPALPPFDPAKVTPIPYEAEIRAFIAELRKEREAKDGEGEEGGDDEQEPDVRLLEVPVTQSRHWWAPWTWGRR